MGHHTRVKVGAAGLLALSLLTPGIAAADEKKDEKKEFRVCADPENMPFSNEKQEGFENKIATVMAKAFDATPTYIWWGQRRGFVRNTMNATLKEGRCNIMIGAPRATIWSARPNRTIDRCTSSSTGRTEATT